MYEEIFKVFEIIKSHCHKNGNKTFEESAIFELLETLYPVHGSIRTIAIITDMLDIQTIRDFKDSSNDSKVEILESDKSNDDDSIIEIEVPPKIHPVVDLTNNSPQSDDALIIENHDEEFGNIVIKNDDHDLSDPETLKPFEDDEFSHTLQSLIRNSNAGPLQNFIDSLGHINEQTSNQLSESINNSGIPEEREISEMFEENNNDPNNNLDEAILDEEPVNNNSNVLMLESIEPVPGCSKNTENWQNDDNSLPHVVICQSKSPVPGCSKDVDNSNDFESSIFFEDESIQNDAICIQEIIPWANLNTIRSILKKHGNSPNRKQLTLWDLMSEVSSQTNAKTVKRKQADEVCIIPKKSPKTEDIDESSLDLPSNIQLNNTACNESSNDSQSSKVSECNESSSEITNKNQKEQLPDTTESSKTFLNKRTSSNSNNSLDYPKQRTNSINDYNLIDEATNLMAEETKKNPFFNKSTNIEVPESNYNCSLPFAGYSIKKERSETIVSGLFVDCNNLMLTNAESPSSNLENITVINGSAPDASNSKPNVTELIQPSKLKVPEKASAQILAKPTTTYIRPATFSYAIGNNSTDQQKVTVKKDLDYSNQKQVITIKPATVTQSNQLHTKPLQLLRSKKDILVVNSGSFPIAIENPFSKKPKNEIEGLSIKPATATGTQSMLFHQFYKPPPLIAQQQLKPAKIKYLQSPTTSNRATTIMKLPQLIPGTPKKVQPSSTITSSSISVQTLHAANQPSTSGVQKIPSPRSVEIPDRQIYNKLRSIFPEVKKSYMKKICISPPDGANYNNKEQIMNILIDHLLKVGNDHLRPINLNVEKEQQHIVSTLSVDEKYEYLLGIFPDADPTYLRDFVEKSCITEQMLQEFIQEKLEKRNYPTKEQYLAKIKITEQIKQYTTDFKVEKFLELFPDPFKHFEGANRKCEYQPIAAEFLKAFFNRNKVNTISRHYLRSRYNISLTAKALSELGSDMKTKRMTPEMPTENIPLLQEITFIKNKQNIQQYIDSLKKQEENLFKDLQEKNLLLTCQCCFNDECMPHKSSECNNGHVFCFDCIIRGTESKLADGEAHVKCFTNCDSEFPLAILQKVLPPTTFSALLKKRQAVEIMAAGMDDLVSCPFCHFASIPPPEDKIFKCLNPECMKETCRQCKELNHIPLRCDEVDRNNKSEKARRLIEEKMTQALLRTCYNCKKQFYKEEGCNKMLCNCGALMCYLCDKPVKGYDHFNPQGGSNLHLCPLWSDDRRLNAEAVRKVAQDMQKAMQQDNPDLEIDMNSLLPKLPPRIKGAHDDIPNANELPEHVRRVAAP